MCNGTFGTSHVFGPIKIKLVFVSTTLLKVVKFQLFSLAPCCQIKRVTDETLIVETAVWHIPFFINVFTALKGSQFYFLFVFIELRGFIWPNSIRLKAIYLLNVKYCFCCH